MDTSRTKARGLTATIRLRWTPVLRNLTAFIASGHSVWRWRCRWRRSANHPVGRARNSTCWWRCSGRWSGNHLVNGVRRRTRTQHIHKTIDSRNTAPQQGNYFCLFGRHTQRNPIEGLAAFFQLLPMSLYQVKWAEPTLNGKRREATDCVWGDLWCWQFRHEKINK